MFRAGGGMVEGFVVQGFEFRGVVGQGVYRLWVQG